MCFKFFLTRIGAQNSFGESERIFFPRENQTREIFYLRMNTFFFLTIFQNDQGFLGSNGEEAGISFILPDT